MHRRFRLGSASRLLGICLLFLVPCWGCATSETSSGGTSGGAGLKSSGVSTVSTSGDSKSSRPVMLVPYYPPPARMDLCGEEVPLQNQEAMERFDKEFTLVVYNHAQVYLWLKRMERYFSWIEDRLRTYGLPDDLKYVAVVESDLVSNACSPKGAAGPWQFMPSTGSAYGLNQTGSCDERYDFERATECAFRYLNDLYRRYRNWTLAIATYNCGDKRIQDQMRYTRDYYQMRLPTETERYVFRILAVKAVLGNPAQYGYNLPKGQGYPPLKVDRVDVSLACPLPLHAVAEASGTTVRELRRLNPALRSDEVPRGVQEIKVPQGQGKGLERGLETIKGRYPAVESTGSSQDGPDGEDEVRAPERHRTTETVKKGTPTKVPTGKGKPPLEKRKSTKVVSSKKGSVEVKSAPGKAKVEAKPAKKR